MEHQLETHDERATSIEMASAWLTLQRQQPARSQRCAGCGERFATDGVYRGGFGERAPAATGAGETGAPARCGHAQG